MRFKSPGKTNRYLRLREALRLTISRALAFRRGGGNGGGVGDGVGGLETSRFGDARRRNRVVSAAVRGEGGGRGGGMSGIEK